MAGGIKVLDMLEWLRSTIVAEEYEGGTLGVFTIEAPQTATYPQVIMNIVSRAESPTQDSGSAVDTYRIQIDVWAKSTSTASGLYTSHLVANNIRQLISRTGNPSSYNPTIIDSVQEANHFTDYIPDEGIYRVTNDYLIRIK